MGLDDMKHPIQPIGDDGKGVLRFKGNKVVQYLLDNGSLDLNDLAVVRDSHDFPHEDWEQFHQLIGYSVSGAPRLSMETRAAVDKMEQGVTDWRDARIAALESTLSELRLHIRLLATAAFDIHPEDLSA